MISKLLTHIQLLDERVIQQLTHVEVMQSITPLVTWILKTPFVKFLPLVLIVCWLWSKKNSQQPRNRFILIEAVFTGFFALFVTRILALTLPYRERPFLNNALHFNLDFGHDLRTWSSFPSDHAVLSFVLAAFIYRISRKLGFYAFFHALTIICLPRLFVGVHYPTDLIAGATFGVLFVCGISRLTLHHRMVNKMLRLEQIKPELFYVIGLFLLFEITEMFKSIRGIISHFFKLVANN